MSAALKGRPVIFLFKEGFEPEIRAGPRATEQLIILLALHGFY